MKRNAPYEVEYRGVVIRCDTPEDVARLARELAKDEDVIQHERWLAHEFMDFVNRIQYQQRRLLALLLKKNMNDHELREALGVSGNQALAGILSGITKVAQIMEIDRRRIYLQRTQYEQGLPVRDYMVAPGFKFSALDNDWPTEKDLVEPQKKGA
jgi:hypothetical protein